MYTPDRQTFRELAGRGNLVPVYREILGDMETPVSAFRKLGNGHSFLLESVEGGERVARYSFLGSEPSLVFSSTGRQVTITRPEGEEQRTLAPGQDPLDVLAELLSAFTFVPMAGAPRFCGGAVGYLGYDLVRFFERLPDDKPDELGLPDCMLVFTDTLLIFDHVRHRIQVLANAFVQGDADAAYDEAVAKIEGIVERLRRPLPKPAAGGVGEGLPADPLAGVSSTFSREGFEQAVSRCKEYIAAGDCIQVVPSQRFSKPTTADPFDIYRALRSVNPSPYMYYLSYGDTKIIGSSPERLVSEEAGEVITRPIAGSRRRGGSAAEDRALAEELAADEKERAEHIMLVDLGRNDLGRVCEPGTVHADELMVVEMYSHVMHLVSNVRGRLRQGLDQFDVLRACFPAGTVSGAPKVRAMEIIQELEPCRRGPYAGAIGYFSFSGNMDTAITIRTIVVQGGVAHVQAGAGIVADSVPATEYQETVNKAAALLRAIQMAEGGLD